jgi:hypothetical protein
MQKLLKYQSTQLRVYMGKWIILLTLASTVVRKWFFEFVSATYELRNYDLFLVSKSHKNGYSM